MATAITPVVKKMLDQENIQATHTSDPPTLGFSVQGANAAWMCVVRVDEDRAIVAFFSLVADPIPEARRAAVSELFTRLNYSLPVGSFELDLDDGDARLKTSADLEDEQPTAGLMRRLLYANVAAMDYYLPVVDAVLLGQTPLAALAAMDEAEDATDEA